MADRIRVGAFASGGGTNLQAIIDASEAGRIDAEVVLLISNKSDAGALERARRHDIPTAHVPVGKDLSDKFFAADERHVALLRDYQVDLVVLAGYMRRIGVGVLNAWPGAVMNIHPAILPSFPGAHGQRDAVEKGVKISGCTVHFADEEFDRGPIIIQAAVPVLPSDDEDALAARILRQEHKIYPQAIQWFAEGRLVIEDYRVRVEPPPPAYTQDDGFIISPGLEIAVSQGL
ncbi:MAG: phosphoribosylglycinamide formyltransferase [Armatimonadetes bacterium]|nr:phosphoribosylglycinamide formyltransferase [Armatimonadota bacterium]